MPVSAGILVYRTGKNGPEFLLGHPGGPFFRKKDEESWTIPKGLMETDEDGLAAAVREFTEETNYPLKGKKFLPLPDVKYKNGKLLKSWAIEEDFGSLEDFRSNTFELEWPPRSGTIQDFPEVDRLEYFPYSEACRKIHPIQLPLVKFVHSFLEGK